MLFKSSFYVLIIIFPFLSISMERDTDDAVNTFDTQEMLKYTIRLDKSSLKNILINYFCYSSPLTIDDIDKLNIPETLINEIRMRRIMSFLKMSSKIDYEYANLNISHDLKRDLMLIKKQIFDCLIHKIESDEQLQKLCKDIIAGLKKTLDINYRIDPDCFAMIHLACQNSDVNILVYVIALGGNIQLTKVHNIKPIHFFATVDIAKCLLLEGCDINALDDSNRTPLMHLCSRVITPVKSLIEKANFLLQHGANINFESAMHNTALMFAIRSKQKELVILLIESGARLDIVNQNGIKAIDLAEQLDSKEIYEIIKAYENKKI